MSLSSSHLTPERTNIGGSLNIPRMIMGLWQLADQNVDMVTAAQAMESLQVPETLNKNQILT
jgi:hypothetical protein